MKKIITIIFVFINAFCHSQQCLSDQYFKIMKSQNPLLEKEMKNVIANFTKNEKNTTNKQLGTLEIPGEEIVIIPVVFNVIHTGEPVGTGKNISSIKIDEQITLLNEAYSGKYGGVDTKIRFCLAKQNTIGQITTGINRFFGNSSYELYYSDFLYVDKQIKGNISPGFPDNLFLNIWVADLKYGGKDDVYGYSFFPFNTQKPSDGIVLDYLKVGVNVTADPNDTNRSNGSTAVHEIGHWLGLFHVFPEENEVPCIETSCETEGDMICDTESVPIVGEKNIAPGYCLGYNCKGQTTDVVQNFMDYQAPARLYCRTKFTAGQKKRMRDIIGFYRPSFYTQGLIFDYTACKASSYGGGGGGCTEDFTLPVQRQSRPNIYQDLSQYAGSSIKYAGQIEVNDKWLVTSYETTGYIIVGEEKPPTPPLDYLLIYKREGCRYALHQSIELSLNSVQKVTDFGLQLNGDEIIVSSSQMDEVYIYRLNQSNNIWSLAQQISNHSSSEVGTSTYTVGRFLFILENNPNADNIFRVYYKNNLGTYVFHQNIAVAGFNLPSLGKYIQSGNFSKTIVNINSNSYKGSYDPPEILVAKSSGIGFTIFELNGNNMWTLANTTIPQGLSTSEKMLDIEMSKDFIYLLTSEQTGVSGSLPDRMNIYSYRYTDRHGGTYPFQYAFTKQELLYSTDNIYDTKLQVFNDQFLFIDKRMRFFYNSNFNTTNFPIWQSNKARLTCAGSILNQFDLEVYGNLAFYGYGGESINIYNVSDFLKREGYDQAFINNTDFYNKKINTVPEKYSTSAQKITVAESNPVQFNVVDKELIANDNIILKPGTTISSGSKVTLKITDSYGLCSSIIASKKADNQSVVDEYFSFSDYLELQDFIKINGEDKAVLSPNPNNGVFTIYLGKGKTKLVTCTIYDSTGKTMYNETTEKPTVDINLPTLSNGIYIIKLTGDNYDETIKFIKQ